MISPDAEWAQNEYIDQLSSRVKARVAQPNMPDDSTAVDRNQTSPIEFAGNDVGSEGSDPPSVQDRSRYHVAHCVGLAVDWFDPIQPHALVSLDSEMLTLFKSR